MIASKHSKKWTPREMSRLLRMKSDVGCIACCLEDGNKRPMEEAHHILRGTKRMGHWFTLPLCKPCHANCHNGTHDHDQQIHYWVVVQHALKLSDELPPSKVFKRIAA